MPVFSSILLIFWHFLNGIRRRPTFLSSFLPLKNNWGVGEFFSKTLKWSGMNDQQRNRTLFECIRDRCERTAPFSNSHLKNKKCDPPNLFILLFKHCSFVTSPYGWVCRMQLLIIHGAVELKKNSPAPQSVIVP